MEGKKHQASQTGDDADIYEATAGWDSYVSGLVSEQKRDIKSGEKSASTARAPLQERRRKPRDRKPSGRRALLLSGQGDTQTEDD
jgi:hypothetical protein